MSTQKERKTKLEAPNAYVLPEDDVHPEKTSKRRSQKLMRGQSARCFAHKHFDFGSWCTALSPILTGGEDSSVWWPLALATPNGNWTDAFRAAEAASVAEAEPNPCCCCDDVRETLLWLVAAGLQIDVRSRWRCPLLKKQKDGVVC